MSNIISKPNIKGSFAVTTLSEEERIKARESLCEDGSVVMTEEELEALKSQYYEKGKTDAIEEAQELVEVARKEAFEEGIVEGKSDAINELEPKYNAVKDIFDELGAEKEKFLKELEAEAVELVLAIEKKIIGYEVQKSKKPLEFVIKEALKTIRDKKNVRIRVPFEDEAYFNQGSNEFLNRFGEDIEVVGDGSIESGGCIVETNIGLLDARLEERWNLIVNKFFAGIKRGDDDIFADMFTETGDVESYTVSGEGDEDSGFVS